ncbi:MAG: S-4TM family putative pore-forming effector [Salinivirgaceae bacterium]|nr:S-4TM family putative pore-forming effector [Salinivirgaceae bacterium]
MNTIHQDQNSPRSITLQAAKSYFYSSAEKAQTVQLLILIANAIFWPVFLAWKPEMKVWSALTALLIPSVELALIEPLQQKWKTSGAKIQEMFDCSLFALVWNDFKIGEHAREEDIAFGAAKFRKSKGDETKLQDWYTFNFPDLPVSHARLICQRANAWWDSELRGKYISIIRWGICLLGLISLVLGIATGLTVEKLILAVIAPITPIGMWGIKEVRKQASVILEGERIVKHLDSIWCRVCSGRVTEEELEDESRSLQNEIYDRRKGNAVNPQWLYWRKRDEFQNLMVEAANQFLADYRKTEFTPKT